MGVAFRLNCSAYPPVKGERSRGRDGGGGDLLPFVGIIWISGDADLSLFISSSTFSLFSIDCEVVFEDDGSTCIGESSSSKTKESI